MNAWMKNEKDDVEELEQAAFGNEMPEKWMDQNLEG